MSFRFEFDERKFRRQVRRVAEEGARELAAEHLAETEQQVQETWNELRAECRGMTTSEAQQLVGDRFRRVGIEFESEDELEEWTSGIIADEDLNLRLNLELRQQD